MKLNERPRRCAQVNALLHTVGAMQRIMRVDGVLMWRGAGPIYATDSATVRPIAGSVSDATFREWLIRYFEQYESRGLRPTVEVINAGTWFRIVARKTGNTMLLTRDIRAAIKKLHEIEWACQPIYEVTRRKTDEKGEQTAQACVIAC